MNKTLIFEYWRKPIIDLNQNFLCRFVAPMETVWFDTTITINDPKSLVRLAFEQWERIVLSSEYLKDSDETKGLSEVDRVEVYECRLTRIQVPPLKKEHK